MRNFIVTAAVVGALSIAGLGAAGAAAAVAFSGATVSDTVSIPRPEGMDSAADGRTDGPMLRCAIANTHGLPVIESAGHRSTAGTLLIDFDCLH